MSRECLVAIGQLQHPNLQDITKATAATFRQTMLDEERSLVGEVGSLPGDAGRLLLSFWGTRSADGGRTRRRHQWAFDHIDQFLGDEDVWPSPLDLNEDLRINQFLDDQACRSVRHAKQLDRFRYCDGRHATEIVDQLVNETGRARQFLTVGVAQFEQASGARVRIATLLDDASDEERDPGPPVAVLTDVQKVIDVRISMTLKVRAHVEQRLREALVRAEQERDQNAAHAPVAVEKGMDRLELVVDECKSNQQRKRARFVEKLFECVQRCDQLRTRRRRDEPGLANSSPMLPDGVVPLPQAVRERYLPQR
jgi:hypothetical protein